MSEIHICLMYGVVQNEGLDMVVAPFWPLGSVREVCNVHVSIELRHPSRVIGAACLSKRRHAPFDEVWSEISAQFWESENCRYDGFCEAFFFGCYSFGGMLLAIHSELRNEVAKSQG